MEGSGVLAQGMSIALVHGGAPVVEITLEAAQG